MASFNRFPHIFSPVRVGPVELKNRLQFPPMVSAHATAGDGLVTDDLVAFIGAQARSGVGLIAIGSTPVNFDRGRDFYGCLSATRDTDIPELERLAIEAHRYGVKLSAELMHAGRIANPGVLAGRPALVPSVIEEMLHDEERTYAEITEEEMLEVVDDFRQAARRLATAGFDLVTIHGAHGNLVSAFLSPRTNLRTDAYGGSLENRMRFPLMICQVVREAIGPNVAIEYRISQNEFIEGGTPLEDVIAFLKEAQRYIDVVHLSGGLICDLDKVKYMMPSYPTARNQNVVASGIVRKELDIPVTVVGGIPDMEAADAIIAEGKADIVAMARNILAIWITATNATVASSI